MRPSAVLEWDLMCWRDPGPVAAARLNAAIDRSAWQCLLVWHDCAPSCFGAMKVAIIRRVETRAFAPARACG